MSEPSYPSPCRSQFCGKTLYGPVTYCPYCGCKIESATEVSKERKDTGQITESDDKVVGAVGYPHTPGHLPLSSTDGDGDWDVSSQPVPAYEEVGIIGQNKTPKGNMVSRLALYHRSLNPRFLLSQILIFTHTDISNSRLSSVLAHLAKPHIKSHSDKSPSPLPAGHTDTSMSAVGYYD